MKVLAIRHSSVVNPQHHCYGRTEVPINQELFEIEVHSIHQEISQMSFDGIFFLAPACDVKLWLKGFFMISPPTIDF